MILIARLVVVALGLPAAVASFAHAASENGMLPFGPGALGRTGIDAAATGEFVTRAFEVDTLAVQATAFASRAGGKLGPEEIAKLLTDPVARERFMAEGREASAKGTTTEFPVLSEQMLTLARTVYAADPLNVPVLRTIVLGRVSHDDSGQARNLMRAAGTLSKRDSMTNLWLAQDYGRGGDIKRMLASLDHTLRTSKLARDVALGSIVGLIASDESHALIGDLLKQRPEWEPAFWIDFVRNPIAVSHAVEFFKNSGIPLLQVPERNRVSLYAGLKREGLFDDFFELVELDPNSKASARRGFIATSADNPTGWLLRRRGDFAATIPAEGKELYIDASAGSAGTAADRLLRGGRTYRVMLAMAEPVPPQTTVRLSAVCLAPENRKFAEIVLEEGGTQDEMLARAQTCTYMSLELSFATMEGRVDPIIRIAAIEVDAIDERPSQ